MPIVSEISDSIEERNLIPIWRGGGLVPDILRKYEPSPPINPEDPTTKDLICNNAVKPDGGLIDGVTVENTVYNRNEEVPCEENFSLIDGNCLPKSNLAFLGDQGLVYMEDNNGNKVPDFSIVGYKGGGIDTPVIPVVRSIQPLGSDLDDTANIQDAIDYVESLPIQDNGFRGTLLLRSGTYKVTDSIRITEDGVVIRGEGASKGGTVIFHQSTEQGPTLVLGREYLYSVDQTGITDTYLPVGSNSFTVEDVSSLAIGDDIVISTYHTDAWLDALELPFWTFENGKGHRLIWERKIKDIDRLTNLVTIEGTTSSILNSRDGYTETRIFKINNDIRARNIGVEDILFVSDYDRSVVDSDGYYTDENHPLTAISIMGIKDAWVERTMGFFYGISFIHIASNTASQITLQDNAMFDGVSKDTPMTHFGGRKYYYNLGGHQVLAQRNFGRGARHTFINASLKNNTVVLDSASVAGHLSSEPHSEWSQAFLFDNLYSDSLINLGQSYGVHGQKAVSSVIWNSVSDSDRYWDNEVSLDNPKGDLGYNYAVGIKITGSAKSEGVDEIGSPSITSKISDGVYNALPAYIESKNQHVAPRSLYLQQLSERLGAQAVENIATRIQINGSPMEYPEILKDRFKHIESYGDPKNLDWLPVGNLLNPEYVEVPEKNVFIFTGNNVTYFSEDTMEDNFNF